MPCIRKLVYFTFMMLTMYSVVSAGMLTAVKHADLPRSFTHKPIPKWENGFLVGFEMEPANAPLFYAYDTDGELVFETQVSIPDAARIAPVAAAASGEGTFAVTGTAYNGSGEAVSFIAWYESDGEPIRLVQLDDCGALRIAFGRDGDLWTVVKAHVPRWANSHSEHDVVRVYTRGGKLKMSLLPLSSFGEIGRRHPAKHCHLAANADYVVLYAEECQQLVGLSHDGEVLYRQAIPDLEQEVHMTTGLAVTQASDIFVSAQVRLDGGRRGAVVTKWDHASNTWSKVYSSQSPKPHILGADEDKLVVFRQSPKLEWIRFE